MINRGYINNSITFSRFTSPNGAAECFIVCKSGESLELENALDSLNQNYLAALKKLDIDQDSIAFCCFHVSDMANQKDSLLNSKILKNVSLGAVSIVEQVPCSSHLLTLYAYHVKDATKQLIKELKIDNSKKIPVEVSIKGKNYSMLWNSAISSEKLSDSFSQTEELLKSFSENISNRNLTIRHNLVRTWIYVRDIDNNYNGMVESRRKFFSANGLTSDTRFIASTGIEGKGFNTHALVTMDCLSFDNITEEQLCVMNALKNLSPAISYGVTFERGLRVIFGDRSHLYISGTASINSKGDILHIGDVEKQALRTIDNIEALLSNQGASINDMAYATIYLRNPKHYPLIKEIIKTRLPQNLPVIAVEGAVCRPGWLFEIDGIAIIPDASKFPPFL